MEDPSRKQLKKKRGEEMERRETVSKLQGERRI